MLRLAEEGAKPRDIVDIALRGAPEDAVGPIGRLEACKRRRRKRFQGGDPPEHRGQEDLAASDAYKELGYGRRASIATTAQNRIVAGRGVLVIAPERNSRVF